SPASACNEPPLLHGWERQSGLSDGVSYLEQPPGLGNERHDPASGLCGVCEDAGRPSPQLHAVMGHRTAHIPWAPYHTECAAGFQRHSTALAADRAWQRIGRKTEI